MKERQRQEREERKSKKEKQRQERERQRQEREETKRGKKKHRQERVVKERSRSQPMPSVKRKQPVRKEQGVLQMSQQLTVSNTESEEDETVFPKCGQSMELRQAWFEYAVMTLGLT